MSPRRHYDVVSPEFWADPHPTWALLRQEAPVYPMRSPGAPTSWTRGTAWYLTRYDDVAAVLKDTRRFVKDYHLAFDEAEIAAQPPEPDFIRLGNQSMINQEGACHTRLRRLVSQAFSPAMVEGMRQRIEAITEELVAKVLERGRMEVRTEYAFPLTITVITSILGLPPEDGDQLREWAVITPPRDEAEKRRAEAGVQALSDYLREKFEERRRCPRADLITALLEAEVEGDRLDDDAMLSMVLLLITAGFETTVNTILNGLFTLLRHPQQCQLLVRRSELLDAAVEEILRYEPPIHTGTLRWAGEDVELRGQQIRRGDRVMPVLAAANRDPEHFVNPDRFDITRILRRPGERHVSFGLGSHYCTGAPLARLEVRIGLGTLLRRLPALRLAGPVQDVAWIYMPPFRGPQILPIAWDSP